MKVLLKAHLARRLLKGQRETLSVAGIAQATWQRLAMHVWMF